MNQNAERADAANPYKLALRLRSRLGCQLSGAAERGRCARRIGPVPAMKLTDIHNRETEIRDTAHLESLLAGTPEIDGFGAFMIYTAVGEPELWLHFQDDIAYPHYFPTSDGSHPGWQPESAERPEHANYPETIPFLQVGAISADRIEMPRGTTVSKQKAIAAAKDFMMNQQLPPSISWVEL